MPRFLKPLLVAHCCAPFGWLLLRAFGVAGLGLGAKPIDELMDRLGEWGLRLLLATLCVTPLAVTLRKPWLMGVRRMLGLFHMERICAHCGLQMTDDLAKTVREMVKTDRTLKWQRFEPHVLAQIIPELYDGNGKTWL